MNGISSTQSHAMFCPLISSSASPKSPIIKFLQKVHISHEKMSLRNAVLSKPNGLMTGVQLLAPPGELELKYLEDSLQPKAFHVQ